MKATEQTEVFIKLLVEYRPRLFRMAKGILKNDNDAEDAVSEATCKAYNYFTQLRDIDKFKPWVMRILVNEAYAIANKRKRFIQLNEDIPVDNSEDEIDDTVTLWDAIKGLKEEFRTVTILFYYEDMSIKEISRILKIPEGTVNSRLNRSRQMLKKVFLHEGGAAYGAI